MYCLVCGRCGEEIYTNGCSGCVNEDKTYNVGKKYNLRKLMPDDGGYCIIYENKDDK